MAQEHKHCHCQHKDLLRYCHVCDVVYCLMCGREWRSQYNITWTSGTVSAYTTSETVNTTATHTHELGVS